MQRSRTTQTFDLHRSRAAGCSTALSMVCLRSSAACCCSCCSKQAKCFGLHSAQDMLGQSASFIDATQPCRLKVSQVPAAGAALLSPVHHHSLPAEVGGHLRTASAQPAAAVCIQKYGWPTLPPCWAIISCILRCLMASSSGSSCTCVEIWVFRSDQLEDCVDSVSYHIDTLSQK